MSYTIHCYLYMYDVRFILYNIHLHARKKCIINQYIDCMKLDNDDIYIGARKQAFCYSFNFVNLVVNPIILLI